MKDVFNFLRDHNKISCIEAAYNSKYKIVGDIVIIKVMPCPEVEQYFFLKYNA